MSTRNANDKMRELPPDIEQAVDRALGGAASKIRWLRIPIVEAIGKLHDAGVIKYASEIPHD